MTGIDHFNKAQAILAKRPNDKQAQFIVDLWNASANLYEKNQKLVGELEVMTLRNAELSRTNDRLLTQAASPRSGSEYLKGLLADPVLATAPRLDA